MLLFCSSFLGGKTINNVRYLILTLLTVNEIKTCRAISIKCHYYKCDKMYFSNWSNRCKHKKLMPNLD